MSSTRTVVLEGNGTRLTLACSAEPYQLGLAATVWGSAPYAVASSRRGALLPGETVDTIHAEPRTFALPVVIEATTEAEMDQRIGALGSILSPTAGPCQVVYTRPDGTSRAITAYALDGISNVPATAEAGYLQRSVEMRLVMRAHFPYWRAVDVVEGSSVGVFADATLGNSNPIELVNDGNVDTWPEVIVAGPCEAIEGFNLSTGQAWRIREQLGAGDRVRIVGDPRSRGVWLNDDTRQDVLQPTMAQPWPLLPGLNRVYLRAINPTGLGSWAMRWPLLFETC